LIVVELVKPVPVTVRVKAPEPAGAVVGLMELTVGEGVEFPELLPEFDEELAPPQPTSRDPARIPDTPRPNSSKDFEGFIRR
jgi:hypothetical protein